MRLNTSKMHLMRMATARHVSVPGSLQIHWNGAEYKLNCVLLFKEAVNLQTSFLRLRFKLPATQLQQILHPFIFICSLHTTSCQGSAQHLHAIQYARVAKFTMIFAGGATCNGFGRLKPSKYPVWPRNSTNNTNCCVIAAGRECCIVQLRGVLTRLIS